MEFPMNVQSSRSTGAENQEITRRSGVAAKANPSETPREAWLIVTLLFLFMLINFADKAVIGIAAVPIMKELQLSPRQFGLVGSSFFLLFSLSAIVTGFIVNRVQTRWALLVMGLVWALTQFPMLGAVGFGTLVACRVALGAGEGPAYPVALHSAYKWFPNELRTLPTAIIAQGAGIGIMVALPLLNWVIVNYSWHWAFGVLGFAGLAWVVAWLLLGREGSLTAATAKNAAPTPPRIAYGQLLRSPTIIASWCASFGAQWGLSQALTWQGAFLIKGLGFAQGSIGLLGALPAGASVILVIAAGWWFATPAHSGGAEPGGARDLRRRLRGARRRGAGDHAVCAGRCRQDRPDDDRGGAAFGHLRDRERRRQRNRAGCSAWGDARHRHRCQHLCGTPRPLCHGQRGRDGGDAPRWLQYRLYDLWCRHAGRRRHRDGADATRARDDAMGE